MKPLNCLLAMLIGLTGNGFTRGAELVLQKGHEGQITGVALSSDGHWMASGAGGDAIKLWNAADGSLVRDLPNSRNELPLSWSPDGRVLLTAARDVAYAMPRSMVGIRVRAMPTGRVLRSIANAGAPLFFDGRLLKECDGKAIRIWNVSTGKLLATRALQSTLKASQTAKPIGKRKNRGCKGWFSDDGSARFFTFSRNGEYVVYGGSYERNRALVWETRSGRLLHILEKPRMAFGLAAVSDDGRFLVTQGDDLSWSPPTDGPMSQSFYARTFQLHLWDLRSQKKLHSWPGYISTGGGVWFLRFSRDGRRVFSAGDGGPAAIWDTRSGRRVRVVKAYGAQDVSANEEVWGSGYTYSLHVSRVATGKTAVTMPGVMGGGASLSWSPNGKYVAGGSPLQIWDVGRAALLRADEKGAINLQGGRWLDNVTLQSEGVQSASWWRIDEAAKSFARQRKVEPFGSAKPPDFGFSGEVFVSPDGQTLLSDAEKFDESGRLYVWDTGASTPRHILDVRPNEENIGHLHAFWLADSVHFLVPTRRGLEVWNAQSAQRERILRAPDDWPQPKDSNSGNAIRLLTVSPDGKYVAVAQFSPSSRGVEIWDTTTGASLRRIEVESARNAAFSKDGAGLAIGIYDYAHDKMHTEIWAWRESLLKPRLSLPAMGLAGNVWEEAPAWSSKGGRIAIGTSEGIQIFDTQNGRLLARLANSNGRTIDTLDADDWLIYTLDGFFSAPDRGRRRVRWRENGFLLPFDSPRDKILRRHFFQPARLAQILRDP